MYLNCTQNKAYLFIFFFRPSAIKFKDLMLKFPHFPEQILQKLDNECLFKVREVARSWKNIIDGRNYPWIRLVNIPMILTLGNTYLHLSAAKGQIEVFKAALSKEENKNVANEFGETFFHLVCRNGHLNISMTTLLTHTVAHSTKPSFRPKTNNQPLKSF